MGLPLRIDRIMRYFEAIWRLICTKITVNEFPNQFQVFCLSHNARRLNNMDDILMLYLAAGSQP